MFKVGEKVWSYSLQEWGTVIVIDETYALPLCVSFVNYYDRYTLDGRFHHKAKAPDLFFDAVTITPPPRPLPDIPVDTELMVWSNTCQSKVKRHFAGWVDGKCACWDDGRTSFTADYEADYTIWDNWEIVE